MAESGTHLVAVMGAVGTHAMSIDEIAETLPISRHAISSAACRLVARGYLERLEIGSYRLTELGRAALERGERIKPGPYRSERKQRLCRDSLRQRAWRAMRLFGKKPFGIAEITQLAQRDERGAEANIRRFVQLLARAGYLVEGATRTEGTAPSSPGFKTWRLSRDTGDVAPIVIDGGRRLRDLNNGEVYPCA